MDRIKEIEDKFINLGNYDPVTIRAFVKKTVDEENGGRPVKLNTAPRVNPVDAFKFLNDNGTGRIAQGVLSLEMISRTLRGIPLASLSLFDARILAYGPEDMKRANPETARLIITANLGISNYYEMVKNVDNDEVAKYKTFMDKIAKEIKSGGFTSANNLVETLVRTKSIVRLALNYKG